jgi:hypothetical protein
MAAAGLLLAHQQPRTLRFTATAAGTKTRLAVITKAVASIDIYINNRPVSTRATTDGTVQITVPATAGDHIRIEGYDPTTTLIAARQLHV